MARLDRESGSHLTGIGRYFPAIISEGIHRKMGLEVKEVLEMAETDIDFTICMMEFGKTYSFCLKCGGNER